MRASGVTHQIKVKSDMVSEIVLHDIPHTNKE